MYSGMLANLLHILEKYNFLAKSWGHDLRSANLLQEIV